MKNKLIISSAIVIGQMCLMTAIAQPTAFETFGEYANGTLITNMNGGTGWSTNWQWNSVGTQTASNGVLYCASKGANHIASWRYFSAPVSIATNTTYYFRADLGTYEPDNGFFWGVRLTDGSGNLVADIDLENAWVRSDIGGDDYLGNTIAYTADGTVVHLIGECQWQVANGATNVNLMVYVLPVVTNATVPGEQRFASTPTWIQSDVPPPVGNIGGVLLDGWSLSAAAVASAQNLYFGPTWADVTPDATAPSQPIAWQDADPASANVSTTDDSLAVQAGQADPAGGSGQVGGVFYTGGHSQYANLGMAYGQAATIGPGTGIWRPFYNADAEVASYTSNYFNGPITFSADIYIPSGSAFGASDSIYLQISYWDQNLFSGSNYPQFNITAAANMQLLDQWQTVTVTTTVPNTNVLMYIQPTVVFDDANQDAPTYTPIAYIRNVNFNMGLAPVSPILSAQKVGGSIVLNWTGAGFKLQTANTLSMPSWTDYALPAGTNPPVVVRISPGATFFRLATQ